MAEKLKVVVFTLNKELYGLDITDVGEIIKMCKIYKVPGLSASVEGVINLRDKVTTIVNLSKSLGFAEAEVNENSKIILMDALAIGLIVDEVTEIINIDSENIVDKANLQYILDSSLIASIAKVNGDIITILNIKELITPRVA